MNPRSRGPEPRGIPGFPTSCQSKRPAGVEPALPPWQGSRLPLHHGRVLMGWIVKDREHRAGLEPTSPHYGCGVLATGRPVRSMSVGPVGIEPTSSGLRDRRIALSATVPCCRRGRSRTFDLTLIRGPLSPLSYAPLSIGPEGLEPTPDGLKVRYAAITPRPRAWSGVCVSSGLSRTFGSLLLVCQW